MDKIGPSKEDDKKMSPELKHGMTHFLLKTPREVKTTYLQNRCFLNLQSGYNRSIAAVLSSLRIKYSSHVLYDVTIVLTRNCQMG